MITLNASGGSVTFTFSGNSTYLNDGTITVPVNSLALIIDESNMATFRKAASNDIFVSANVSEFGMTKAELESWFKANAVGSTGGGGGITSGEVQTMIDESISGKVDTEDLNISGKTLYVGDYCNGAAYEMAKNYSISTKPTKLLVKTTDDADVTNVVAFQLKFDNGTTSGSCILKVSTAVGSGITEAAWQVETPEANLELVNGEVYITFLNGYYLTMFNPGAYQYFVMHIVTDIESGSTPSVVESGIYNALDKMSETLTDVITKSDAAYYRGISNPSLYYDISSGITLSSFPISGGDYNYSSIATDASINANNGVLGVYTTGATHAVIKNYSVISNRIYINSIPSNIKMYWNLSYTGNTSHFIAVSCTVNDGSNGYCQWDWENNQYVPNDKYINTAVTLSYDSTNQVVTITPSSSSALTSIIYIRCNRNIAPATALTQDNCRIGLVTIDTNSYKLQEALDNKQDTLSAGTNITISGNVISANGVQVSSAITENDTNAVAGGAVYDKVHVTSGNGSTTLLTFAEPTGSSPWYMASNYPSGVAKFDIELDLTQWGRYNPTLGFHDNNNNDYAGQIINTDGVITYVDVSDSMYSTSMSATTSYTNNVFTIEVTGLSGDAPSGLTMFRLTNKEPVVNAYAIEGESVEYWIKDYVDAKMGGMTIVKITESDYQSLSVKDPGTLYVVIPDPVSEPNDPWS